jgi:transketolase
MFAAAHPERFFQIGIAEQNMTSIAAGMASMGLIPFTSTFACFASKRATDQVRIGIAQPRMNVKITGAYSGLLAGKTGKTHQSVQDIAIFRSMPEMVVLVPGDGVEVEKAVWAAAEYEGPVYLRLTRDPSPVLFDAGYDFRIGKAVVLREGSDVTVVTTGVMAARALEAASTMSDEGLSVHILHVPTVKPLDIDAVLEAAARTGLVVTAEEHSVIGGLGGAVAEVLSEHPRLLR